MKLNSENSFFVGDWKHVNNVTSFTHGVPVSQAQGVIFECPKCGNHSVLVWFANPQNGLRVPDDVNPKPRWTFSGDSLETLTLTPSVDLSRIDDEHPADASRCYWHGWVTNGEAN